MSNTVLILGASGRFGRHAKQAFETAGWTVRCFDRARDDLSAAARGADLIVNAWNPPDYSTWTKDMLVLHQRVIDAALASKATILVPGNVYVFGADTPGPWSETTPHKATNPLGRVRRDMEAAYRRSGVKTILLRAGDFLDTQASGNWFDRVMVTRLAKGRCVYPGDPDLPHAWAYLPDMAEAAVRLAARQDQLPTFADIPFPGYSLTGRQICAALSQVLHRPVSVREMSWWPLRLLVPLVPSFAGLLEMRYLWNTPHSLDGTRFADFLPGFVHTPVETALRAACAHVIAGQEIPVPDRPRPTGDGLRS